MCIWTDGGVGRVKIPEATSIAVVLSVALLSSLHERVNEDSRTSRILDTILQDERIFQREYETVTWSLVCQKQLVRCGNRKKIQNFFDTPYLGCWNILIGFHATQVIFAI